MQLREDWLDDYLSVYVMAAFSVNSWRGRLFPLLVPAFPPSQRWIPFSPSVTRLEFLSISSGIQIHLQVTLVTPRFHWHTVVFRPANLAVLHTSGLWETSLYRINPSRTGTHPHRRLSAPTVSLFLSPSSFSFSFALFLSLSSGCKHMCVCMYMCVSRIYVAAPYHSLPSPGDSYKRRVIYKDCTPRKRKWGAPARSISVPEPTLQAPSFPTLSSSSRLDRAFSRCSINSCQWERNHL